MISMCQIHNCVTLIHIPFMAVGKTEDLQLQMSCVSYHIWGNKWKGRDVNEATCWRCSECLTLKTVTFLFSWSSVNAAGFVKSFKKPRTLSVLIHRPTHRSIMMHWLPFTSQLDLNITPWRSNKMLSGNSWRKKIFGTVRKISKTFENKTSGKSCNAWISKCHTHTHTHTHTSRVLRSS